MEEGNKLEQANGAMRMLVLWRDLWSQENANARTVTDLNLDDSRVWITVYQG
jgi:hypothetical protein